MIDTATYDEYQGAIIQGDKHKCFAVVEKLLDEHHDAKDIYLNLFQTSLYEIGHKWETGETSVAIEHMVSNITERLIERVYAKFVTSPPHGKKIVLTTCDDEYHKIGAKIVCDFFEINHWTAYFLGASTPTRDIIAMIEHVEPDVVGISLTVADKQEMLITTLKQIHRTFPKVSLIFGGQAIEQLNAATSEQLKSLGTRYLATLDDVEQYLKQYELQAAGA